VRTDTLDRGCDSTEDAGAPYGATIETIGLSFYTHLGLGAAEREVDQRLIFDTTIDIAKSD
jgi:dihydroneopterin aldolase